MASALAPGNPDPDLTAGVRPARVQLRPTPAVLQVDQGIYVALYGPLRNGS